MPNVTVKEFANVIGLSVERLQKQLKDSGLPSKAADDVVTDEEKSSLLDHLRMKRGQGSVATKKITLTRKTVGEIKIPSGIQSRNRTKSKTVSVEFRRKRTYVKRSVLDELTELEKPDPSPHTLAESHGVATDNDTAAAKDMMDESAVLSTDVTEAEQQSPDKLESSAVAQDDQLPADVQKDQGSADELEAEESEQDPVEAGGEENLQDDQIDDKSITPPKTEDKDKGKATRYGRQELHVATDKSGRRKKRQRYKHKIIPKIETQHGFEKPTEPVVRQIEIPESISVGDLAQKMSVKATEVIKLIMDLGSMATINQMLDQETAALIVEESGHKVKYISPAALEDKLFDPASADVDQVPRAPVVTIMGHVDHGKTTLLDYIRNSRIADGESGGITQHIGAYVVSSGEGKITFLDTPGHAAFTAMRARGARVTDIVVLVVAADDGVMPQTKEAIEHVKQSNVPIIVAINKIDKAEADPDRIKQELSKFDVIPEDWGGDTQFVNVSAKTGKGIDQLLGSISLQAELLELKAAETGPAVGTVIESRLDKGRGPIATILVLRGALSKGDVILSGKEFGHVRAIIDSNGKEIQTPAGPSTPVEILGLSGMPDAGDGVIVVSDEKKAREIAELRSNKKRESKLAKQHAIKLQNAMMKMSEDKVAKLNILIKADTHGSSEAIGDALSRLSNDEVQIAIISRGVGGITETDMNLASASEGMVIGFNVRADAPAREFADAEGIEIRYYSIIYDLIDDMRAFMSGMLEPDLHEKIIGIAEVKNVFPSPKFGDIAGCIVSEGVVKKSNPIRVLRDDVVIYEGKLESLRRFKDDVNEVQSGVECGIGVKDYNNVRAGDQIEVFERIEVERTI